MRDDEHEGREHEGRVNTPVELRDVGEVAALAEEVVSLFEQELAGFLPGVEVHHIGATAMPFGHTKGDVDVNLRVDRRMLPEVVAALGHRWEVAQAENWTASFASFSTARYPLPLGIQVTVIGSEGDFLLALRDRMRSDPELLREYDARKVAAAPGGPTAYWEAKNELLRRVLAANGPADESPE